MTENPGNKANRVDVVVEFCMRLKYPMKNLKFYHRGPALLVTMWAVGLLCMTGLHSIAGTAVTSWRTATYRATLSNDALEATFQSGFLCQLKDRVSGKTLLSVEPGKLPSSCVVFDDSPTDLDVCQVSQKVTRKSVVTTFTAPNGAKWKLQWSIEPGIGDLVLRASSKCPNPVEQVRVLFFGCDIADHSLVWVTHYGVGEVAHAPWAGVALGDPTKDDSPANNIQPLVALFEGKDSGWFLAGRDLRIGPSSVLIKGEGNTATVGMVRRFPIPTKTPALYEIRLRTYRNHWEDAVDPYINWMEKRAGFVPLEKKSPAWIKNVKNESAIEVGDSKALADLAKRVDLKKTIVTRSPGYRYLGTDQGYPDYRVRPGAKEWFKQARALGFHISAWFNSNGVCTDFPGWERFKPGFAVTGKDANGKETYESVYNNYFIRCSPAYKPWRDYLIRQMKEAVDAGVDVVYLDESNSITGKSVVNGMDRVQGMMLLMEQTLKTYRHVAIETEQFNPMTARYGAFAITQMPLGHPLGGYIFHRFVKVVPDGFNYSPTDTQMMDAFESWGFMLPGASPQCDESWMEIVEAFQRYDLVPDSRLPHREFTKFQSDPSGGMMPVADYPLPPEGVRLFGYRGRDGITAYFEKHPHKRGLVVYEPGKDPQWFGTRYSGLTSYAGPGVPVYFYFRHTVRDWLIYDGDTLLGLDPKKTYWFDKTLKPSANRFHVTKVPADFAGVIDWNTRIPDQETGPNDAYFRLTFSGKGQVAMHVPGEYDVYLNGEKVPVDRETNSATAPVNGTTDRPAVLLAVRRSATELVGSWLKLPWQASLDNLCWISPKGDDKFGTSVGGIGRISGRMPNAKSIRLQGAYRMLDEGPGPPGDGVVRINGKEVLRVPYGERPYQVHKFDADISGFAGQSVLFEFLSDGWPGRNSSAEWLSPRIVVDTESANAK